MNDVPRMPIKDLAQYPDNVKVPQIEKMTVSQDVPPADDNVGIFAIIGLWIKDNLINDILNFESGAPMDSKPFYASKTLWTNCLMFAWQFIGPVIGIPTLSPELMIAVLAIINVILRSISKGAVTLS